MGVIERERVHASLEIELRCSESVQSGLTSALGLFLPLVLAYTSSIIMVTFTNDLMLNVTMLSNVATFY